MMNQNSFSNTMNVLGNLINVAEKFDGFATPEGVEKNIVSAASKMEGGQEEWALSLLREAQGWLEKSLRGFINNSPAVFSRQLATAEADGLDIGSAKLLRNILRNYAKDVQAGEGWEPALKHYVTVRVIIERTVAKSAAVKAEKAAAFAARFEADSAMAAAGDLAAAEAHKAAAAKAKADQAASVKEAADKARRSNAAAQIRGLLAKRAA